MPSREILVMPRGKRGHSDIVDFLLLVGGHCARVDLRITGLRARHVSINPVCTTDSIYTRVSCLTTKDRAPEGRGNSLVITEVTPGSTSVNRMSSSRRGESAIAARDAEVLKVTKRHCARGMSLTRLTYCE